MNYVHNGLSAALDSWRLMTVKKLLIYCKNVYTSDSLERDEIFF